MEPGRGSYRLGVLRSAIAAEFLRPGLMQVLTMPALLLEGVPLQPDVAVYRRRGLSRAHDAESIQEAPLLAVEIVWPGSTFMEQSSRMQAYLDGGTPNVWLITPALQKITVFNHTGMINLPGGPATDPVTGLTLNPAVIFA